MDNNNQKTSTILYLPLVFIIIVLLTYLVYLKRALLLDSTIWQGLYEYGIYLLLMGTILFLPLLLGYIRHRSWRFYLPLLLPVAVIISVTINFYSSPNWNAGEAPDLFRGGSFEEITSTWPDTRYFIIRDYLKGKTLVISDRGSVFDSLLFEDVVNSEIEFRKYPYTLTPKEFAVVRKQPMVVKIGWYKRTWISLLPDTSHTDRIYITYYDINKIIFLPEDVMLSFRSTGKNRLKESEREKPL